MYRAFVALAGLSIALVAGVAVLTPAHDADFQRYFGAVDPRLAMTVVSVAGFAALVFLQSRGWFQIYAPGRSRQGVLLAAALATLLAIPVIFVDVAVGFPRDMNVPVPGSLLFYPAMGYVVEVVFHLLPIVVLMLLSGLVTRLDVRHRVWLCLGIVALLEPALQVAYAIADRSASGLVAYVALHLLAFNVLELYLFRRFDFVAMYSFRLVYYLYWHVIWGYWRLQWLF